MGELIDVEKARAALEAGGVKERPDGVVKLADVASERVTWLWQPYLPLRKIALIDGDPAVGKTWLSHAIAASVTLGTGLPGTTKREPANVLLLSAEDGVADTIRPRLEALGADVHRVFVLGGILTLNKPGSEQLEAMIRKYQAVLVFIDPLVAYLGGRLDINRANETREVMARLAGIAHRQRCSIVGIRHLTKSNRDRAIYRGTGSIDLTAACRSVLLVGKDAADDLQRAVVHIKSNLAPLGPTLGYRIEDGAFRWTGTSKLTAADLLAADSTEGGSALEEAKQYILESLAEGPVPSLEIFKGADQFGISNVTLKRAKADLGIRSSKKGFTDGQWHWLPPEGDQPPGAPSDQTNLDTLRGRNGYNSLSFKDLTEESHTPLFHEPLRGNGSEGDQGSSSRGPGPLPTQNQEEI